MLKRTKIVKLLASESEQPQVLVRVGRRVARVEVKVVCRGGVVHLHGKRAHAVHAPCFRVYGPVFEVNIVPCTRGGYHTNEPQDEERCVNSLSSEHRVAVYRRSFWVSWGHSAWGGCLALWAFRLH